jgi:sigma-B regulation protein RsbQ
MTEKFRRLHGTISGSGATTVILGHGFGTDQTAWRGVRDWLDARFRVVSFDMAGAGPDGERSYDPRRYGSLFGYADDLLEVIDELALENCIYIGHSVSCMIGVAAAVTRPDPFKKLLLIGGSPRYLNDDGYVGGFDQDGVDGLHDGMASNFQAWAAGFVPLVVGIPNNPAVDEFSRTLFLMRPDIALNISRTIFQSDMRETVKRLERPAHIIQTQRDMAVPGEVAAWLHGHIERSTLDVIDAEGHVPHMTAPDQIIGVFERYLSVAAA